MNLRPKRVAHSRVIVPAKPESVKIVSTRGFQKGNTAAARPCLSHAEISAKRALINRRYYILKVERSLHTLHEELFWRAAKQFDAALHILTSNVAATPEWCGAGHLLVPNVVAAAAQKDARYSLESGLQFEREWVKKEIKKCSGLVGSREKLRYSGKEMSDFPVFQLIQSALAFVLKGSCEECMDCAATLAHKLGLGLQGPHVDNRRTLPVDVGDGRYGPMVSNGQLARDQLSNMDPTSKSYSFFYNRSRTMHLWIADYYCERTKTLKGWRLLRIPPDTLLICVGPFIHGGSAYYNETPEDGAVVVTKMYFHHDGVFKRDEYDQLWLNPSTGAWTAAPPSL